VAQQWLGARAKRGRPGVVIFYYIGVQERTPPSRIISKLSHHTHTHKTQAHEVIETGCRAVLMSFGQHSLRRAELWETRLRRLGRELVRGSLEILACATLDKVRRPAATPTALFSTTLSLARKTPVFLPSLADLEERVALMGLRLDAGGWGWVQASRGHLVARSLAALLATLRRDFEVATRRALAAHRDVAHIHRWLTGWRGQRFENPAFESHRLRTWLFHVRTGIAPACAQCGGSGASAGGGSNPAAGTSTTRPGRPTLQTCVHCQGVAYCSPECADRHWESTHGSLCPGIGQSQKRGTYASRNARNIVGIVQTATDRRMAIGTTAQLLQEAIAAADAACLDAEAARGADDAADEDEFQRLLREAMAPQEGPKF
jgi:hypothetical protein